MSPDEWQGDLRDYVETILVPFARTLGMTSRDDRLPALGRQLLSALERRRFHQTLARTDLSHSDLDGFVDDARQAQEIISKLRRSTIWPWLQAKYGVVPSPNDSVERTLQLAVQYNEARRQFQSEHMHSKLCGELKRGVDAKGNNLLILDDLPQIYLDFKEGAKRKKGRLRRYRFPDVVGQSNPTSAYINFLLDALDVLSISPDSGEWTNESLVKRISRARDSRRKKRT